MCLTLYVEYISDMELLSQKDYAFLTFPDISRCPPPPKLCLYELILTAAIHENFSSPAFSPSRVLSTIFILATFVSKTLNLGVVLILIYLALSETGHL